MKKKQINFLISEDEYYHLKQLALDNRVSLTKLVMDSLKYYEENVIKK